MASYSNSYKNAELPAILDRTPDANLAPVIPVRFVGDHFSVKHVKRAWGQEKEIIYIRNHDILHIDPSNLDGQAD